MKRLLSLLCLFGLAASSATLKWIDPNTADAGIIGYKIVRLVGTNWVEVATTTEKQWPIVLPVGKHKIAVIAFNSEVEAAPSAPKDFWLILAVTDLTIEQ